VIFAEAVGEVLLVILLHQTFVIYEEDIGGYRDSRVAIIGCCGGVKELESFVAFFSLGRFFLKCEAKKSVELARGDRVLCMFSDISNLTEDESDRLFL